MSNLVYTFDDIKRQLSIIVQEIQLEGYRPSVIMAPARGGLAIGVMLSHYFDCPFQDFTWHTRDGEKNEIHEDSKRLSSLLSKYKDKNILIIDDINDSGRTLTGIAEIVNDNEGIFLHGDLKYAVLCQRFNTGFNEVDFIADYIETDKWVDFPWENWWAR